jgi:hypothetical protein
MDYGFQKLQRRGMADVDGCFLFTLRRGIVYTPQRAGIVGKETHMHRDFIAEFVPNLAVDVKLQRTGRQTLFYDVAFISRKFHAVCFAGSLPDFGVLVVHFAAQPVNFLFGKVTKRHVFNLSQRHLFVPFGDRQRGTFFTDVRRVALAGKFLVRLMFAAHLAIMAVTLFLFIFSFFLHRHTAHLNPV